MVPEKVCGPEQSSSLKLWELFALLLPVTGLGTRGRDSSLFSEGVSDDPSLEKLLDLGRKL
jgi:hypothetical protein